MLTYEATDYTRMEWNFCQSRPVYNPANGNPVCFSNDPRSYLTWGPNGATAGGGREVQPIIQAVDATAPALINESFGTEAGAVRRVLQMRDRDAARSLGTYLCGVGRRAAPRDVADGVRRFRTGGSGAHEVRRVIQEHESGWRQGLRRERSHAH